MQSKRILLPLLAVLMVCLLAGMGSIPAAAASAAPAVDFDLVANVTASNAVQQDPLIVGSGETLTVSIAITSNYGANMAEFRLLYDPNAVELVMNGQNVAYTAHDDVFVASQYTKNIYLDGDGELVCRYLNTSATGTGMAKTGKWIDFTFKVKEGYHGDIRFSLPRVIAISGDSLGFGKGLEGFAGVHNLLGDPGVEEATCTTPAAKVYHCDFCDQDVKIVTALPLDHDLVAHAEKAVTCTEDGNKAYWSCNRCNKAFLDAAATVEVNLENVIFAHPGHDWEITPGKAPTCTETGLSDAKVCKREGCGVIESTQTVIEATGHDWQQVDDGKKQCKNCDIFLEDEGSSNGLTIVLIVLISVVVVVAAGVVAYFFIFKKQVKRY